MSSVSPNGRKLPNPRICAKPLVGLVEEIRRAGGDVGVEIVRPGTWRGVKEMLDLRGKGYFHLVHFDVHARWNEVEQE